MCHGLILLLIIVCCDIFFTEECHFLAPFSICTLLHASAEARWGEKRLSPVYWSAAAAALHRCNYAWDVGGAVQRAAMNLSVMMWEHSRDGIKQQVQCTLNFHALCVSDWNKAKEVKRAHTRASITNNHLVIQACDLFPDISNKTLSKPTLANTWPGYFI